MRSSSPVSTDPHEPNNEHDNDQAKDVFSDPKDGLVSLPQSPLAQAALFVLDRTLRDTGFDISCLDALDEQLLRSPTDSFLDICWTAAVQEERVQRKQDVFQELNVDVVDMGVDVDAVHGDQMHTVEKYPKIEPRGISVPSTPQQSFAVRRKPPPTLSPLSSSLSSAESEILVDQSLDPRRKLVEDAAPSPQYHEKKVLVSSRSFRFRPLRNLLPPPLLFAFLVFRGFSLTKILLRLVLTDSSNYTFYIRSPPHQPPVDIRCVVPKAHHLDDEQ